MPKVATVCSDPTCHGVRGRCAHRRGTRQQQGYGAAHQQWRALVLARDPICVQCRRHPSKHADHIVAIEAGGARFDVANGQGLCPSCHSRKTALVDGGFGRPAVRS